MIQYFHDLGRQIEDRWRGLNYDEQQFPELVVEALQARPPVEHVQLSDIYDWVFDHGQGFQQPDRSELFGEPPVQLYESAHFYMEVLFWRTATTDIHQHGFSGAFYVLAGSSVHSHWSFETTKRISSSMCTGRMSLESTEILGTGDFKPIHSGDGLIHQLFHLEVPSVTLVIRTYREWDRLPQFSYRPPGLGVAHASPDPLMQQRLLFLDGMAQGDLDGLETYALRLVETADIKTIYYALDTLMRRRRLLSDELLAQCFHKARERHGDIVELLWQVYQGQERIRLARTKRQQIKDPDARFLLALLMLMPDRASIFSAIRLRDNSRSEIDNIEAWLAPVAAPETVGFALSGARAAIFRGLVLGEGKDEIIQRLGKLYPAKSLKSRQADLELTIGNIASSKLFYPLFSESPLRSEIGFPNG